MARPMAMATRPQVQGTDPLPPVEGSVVRGTEVGRMLVGETGVVVGAMLVGATVVGATATGPTATGECRATTGQIAAGIARMSRTVLATAGTASQGGRRERVVAARSRVPRAGSAPTRRRTGDLGDP